MNLHKARGVWSSGKQLGISNGVVHKAGRCWDGIYRDCNRLIDDAFRLWIDCPTTGEQPSDL